MSVSDSAAWVAREIRCAGPAGITRSRLTKKFASRGNAAELSQALGEVLALAGYERQDVETGGRPGVVYAHIADNDDLAAELDKLRDDMKMPEPPPHVIAQAAHHTGKSGWKVDITSDFADLSCGETGKNGTDEHLVAADDWDGVLRHFGLNPDEFEIVDDTVRMGSWQQSKGLEDGTRDTITLYSYRARFARIRNRLPKADLDAAREQVWKWRPLARRTPGSGLGAPCTFYIGWSDWQIGKDGTREFTIPRVHESIERSIDRIKELRKVGRNIEGIAVANMGDPNEGCDGNYASQPNTIEMNQREQLNTALALWLTGLRALVPMAEKFDFISVLCNHGEWTRNGLGTRPITSDSDNIGGFLADQLRVTLSDRDDFEHIRWTIPGSEMTVTTELSGVLGAFAHGHKTPGTAKELEWMQAQSLRILRERGREPRLWMVAHRHTLDIKDHGPWWRIQHPSLDTGSKWFADIAGKWSSPGTFTCLIGEHEQAGGPLRGMGRGFSDDFLIVPSR